MLYKRGRYYWMKFKWKEILIRESTLSEDLATAKKILRLPDQQLWQSSPLSKH